MKKSREQIMNELVCLQDECSRLEAQYDMYYRMAGCPKYSRDIRPEVRGYVETYRNIASRLRSVRSRITRLKKSLANLG